MNLDKCLLECNKCKKYIIKRIDADVKAKIRLAHLGLLPGTTITKTREAPFNGPIEVMVKNAPIVIGHGLAEKIMVRCPDSEVLH